MAITIAGHSPGQQVFVIEAAEYPLVLASDAVHLYDELEYNRPFAVVANLVEMYAAYDLLRELEAQLGAVVVPGHDPRLAERFESYAGAPPALACCVA